jgi:hypothetical protein
LDNLAASGIAIVHYDIHFWCPTHEFIVPIREDRQWDDDQTRSV